MTARFPASRRALAEAQGYVCPWCKLPLPEDLTGTAKDHIIPRCRGGPHEPWNLQLLHFKCNGPSGKWHKLTPEAEALARERSVILHLPIPASAIADRPLNRGESLRRDYLNDLVNATAEERDHVIRRYLDEFRSA